MKKQALYRLFIRKIMKEETDRNGRKITYTKWFEVPEASIGSKKNPDRTIVEFAFVPTGEIEKIEYIYPNRMLFSTTGFDAIFNDVIKDMQRLFDNDFRG